MVCLCGLPEFSKKISNTHLQFFPALQDRDWHEYGYTPVLIPATVLVPWMIRLQAIIVRRSFGDDTPHAGHGSLIGEVNFGASQSCIADEPSGD
jgi:hypothetical protein